MGDFLLDGVVVLVIQVAIVKDHGNSTDDVPLVENGVMDINSVNVIISLLNLDIGFVGLSEMEEL